MDHANHILYITFTRITMSFLLNTLKNNSILECYRRTNANNKNKKYEIIPKQDIVR